MAGSHLNSVLLTCLGAVSLAVGATEAPTGDGAYTWSADKLNSDFRSDTLDLAGNVRVSQGDLSIEAQAATAKNFRSDSSEWTFEEAVHIRSAQADLRSNIASAAFVNGAITKAHVEGTPAEFEQRGLGADSLVRGRAGAIDYDFTAGIVQMTHNVWFTNGKDEFRGDVVIYNVREERVQINPGGQSPGRVQGVIRPRPAVTDPPADEARPDGNDGNGA